MRFFALLVSSCMAFQSNAFVGSVTAATGGAGAAVVEASESPFINPASIAHLQGYYFTSSLGAGKKGGLGSEQDLGISLTDNMKDTIVPTAIAYSQEYFDTPNDQDISDRRIRLGFGNYIAKKVSLGVAFIQQENRTPDRKYDQGNLDLGVLYTPSSNMGFGMHYQNVLGGKIEVPDQFRQDSALAAGFVINYKKFYRFKFDLQSAKANNFEKPTLKMGVETYLNNWIIARFGAAKDNFFNFNVYSAGMGFIGPKFALHYAYQNSQQEESVTRHSIDLALPLW